MNENTHVSYRINSRGEITFISDERRHCALSNDADSLARKDVLHHSLWDFICDETVRTLYREILRRVGAGHSLKFNLRCDSPALRRIIEVNITPQENGELQFDNRTIWTEERAPAILFNEDAARINNLLIMCSWCNKIETANGHWQEVEQAVETLNLFELEYLPTISHGMCNVCFEEISAKLEKLKAA